MAPVCFIFGSSGATPALRIHFVLDCDTERQRRGRDGSYPDSGRPPGSDTLPH